MDQDARISRLARALPRADTEEIFTSTCRQIQELLEIGENRRYVARSFNCLLTPLESTFKFLSSMHLQQGLRVVCIVVMAVLVDLLDCSLFVPFSCEMAKSRGGICKVAGESGKFCGCFRC